MENATGAFTINERQTSTAAEHVKYMIEIGAWLMAQGHGQFVRAATADDEHVLSGGRRRITAVYNENGLPKVISVQMILSLLSKMVTGHEDTPKNKYLASRASRMCAATTRAGPRRRQGSKLVAFRPHSEFLSYSQSFCSC